MADDRPQAALSVEDLRVEFPDSTGAWHPVVDGISFHVDSGETLGFVGESGSGKTVTALSLVGLVPSPGRVGASKISIGQLRVEALAPKRWPALRGKEIGMIFQDALSALNPVRSIGSLLIEAIRRHQDVRHDRARELAVEALRDVGIPKPDERMKVAPHQLSGGLRQRVMIALAIVNRPGVIIADEPTTALDATIQAQILELLGSLVTKAAMILITHDLGVAASICDRIAVIYAGRLAEVGSADQILKNPRHPYTAGLINAVPSFTRGRVTLVPIDGSPPAPEEVGAGCAFAPRCPRALEKCRTERPELAEVDGRLAACWNPQP